MKVASVHTTTSMHAVLNVLICLMIVIPGCRSLPEPSPAAIVNRDTKPWERDQVVGLTVTLIDPKRYEYMSFVDGGHLVGTYGEVGGKICGPVFGWRLIKGRLFICDYRRKRLEDELFLVSMSEHTLTVRRSTGEIARYKIHKNQ